MKRHFVTSLRHLLGKNKVSDDTEILEKHSGDAWFASHKPDVVVFAESTRDVSRLLKFASEKKIPVTTRGGGRGYVGGCVPVKGGIVLSLARMNKIKEISLTDSIAVVEPGVITAHLQNAAKKHGLFYPPDPASQETCTIGGNIATNAGGARCLKYGVTRNYVLALEIVMPNGDIVNIGARTVKNKTGFSLAELFIGSEGMLGVVTEATLRLLPHPPTRSALVATFKHASQTAKFVLAIQKTGILPAAFEIADAFTLRSARAFTKNVPPGDAFVLLEVDGQPASVKNEIEILEKIFQQQGALKILRADGEKACEKLWNMRRAFSDSLKATGLKKLNEDIVVPRGKLVNIITWAEKIQKKTKTPIACFGHAGDGNIHVNIMVPFHSNLPMHQRLLDNLFKQVLAWGGAITGEHGIGLAKKHWWPQAASPTLRSLHLKIKKSLDPHNILNPGKFLDK